MSGHTPGPLESARAATAKFARAMSNDPMIKAADALADALEALLDARDDAPKLIKRARAALRAAGRLP